MKNTILLSVAMVALLCLSACSGEGGAKPNVGPGNEKLQRIDWDNIPAEYEKTVVDNTFSIFNISTVEVSVYGFRNDVSVEYSPMIANNTANVRVSWVSEKYKPVETLRVSTVMSKVSLIADSNYDCGIKTENNTRVTEIKGACVVRVQILLPPGARIEVLNAGERLTPAFNGATNEELFYKLERSVYEEDKLKVIDTYLESYYLAGKQPQLTPEEVRRVLNLLILQGDKLKALRKLHATVNDRQGLAVIVDLVFFMPESKEEAHRISGLYS